MGNDRAEDSEIIQENLGLQKLEKGPGVETKDVFTERGHRRRSGLTTALSKTAKIKGGCEGKRGSI